MTKIKKSLNLKKNIVSITNKKVFVIIAFLLLILLLGASSYAFYSYVKRSNNVSVQVGSISFDSTEGNTINLTNAFPTSSNNLNSTNSSTVTITVEGDTTYESGIEYRAVIFDVHNTINGKTIPISFNVEATDLGTLSDDYYNDRGSTDNVYGLIESGDAEEDMVILTGYIKPNSTDVNGSFSVTAYLDKDKIAISDTAPSLDNGSLVYGETDGEWISGRTILTTTEWNSLYGENALSFKIRVDAKEGLFVQEQKYLVMKNLYSDSNWEGIRANITSIEFSTNPTVPANAITSFDATDSTSEGPVTVYTLDDGLGNGTYKAVICGDGVIYAPSSLASAFRKMSKLKSFNSTNFRTDNTTRMSRVFSECPELENIDGLENWNTSQVTTMSHMFSYCYKLTNVNGLANWNTSSLTTLTSMFYNCYELANINGLANWNTSLVTAASMMFHNTALTNVDGLANWNTSSATDMSYMFANCTSLTNINGLAKWDTSSATNMPYMFTNTKISSLTALRNWNVSGVTNFCMMFGNNSFTTTLNGLEGWNVSSATDMTYMFYNNSNLTDASAINNWNINANINFTAMFGSDSVYPTFTRVAGVWNSEGTFIPYTALTYITPSGTSYINTGVAGNRSDSLKFYIKYAWVTLPTGYAYVFGTYTGEDTNATRLLQYKSNVTYTTVNAKAGGGTIGGSSVGERTASTIYEETIERTLYTSNGREFRRASSFQTGTDNSKVIYLFRANGNTTISQIKLYYFKIYDGNTLLRDYIPCQLKTGTIGLCDVANGQFYGSATSDTFSGPSS